MIAYALTGVLRPKTQILTFSHMYTNFYLICLPSIHLEQKDTAILYLKDISKKQ